MNYKEIYIIANLVSDLKNIGFHKEAGEMVNLLNDLIDVQTEDEKQKPVDKTISGNGLREDGTVENFNQGFSVEPIYFR